MKNGLLSDIKAPEGQIHVPPVVPYLFRFQIVTEEIVHIDHQPGGPGYQGSRGFYKSVQRCFILLWMRWDDKKSVFWSQLVLQCFIKNSVQFWNRKGNWSELGWKNGIKCWKNRSLRILRGIQNIQIPSSKLPFLKVSELLSCKTRIFVLFPRGVFNGNIDHFIRYIGQDRRIAGRLIFP